MLAILLLIFAIIAIFLGAYQSWILPFAGLLGLGSVYLFKLSNIQSHQDSARRETSKRPSLLLLSLSGALLVGLAVSAFYLYRDAIHGYHNVQPVYAFAGVAAACILVWSYLLTRILK